MKDLGEAYVIFNIKLVKETNGGVTLTLFHYMEKVLSRFGYSDYKPVSTPYDASLILRKNKRIMRDQLRYSQIIGSLMYLPSATRPGHGSLALGVTWASVVSAVAFRSEQLAVSTLGTM